MLDETFIPAHLLPKARNWFNNQVAALEKQHGAFWPDHREWLCQYLNEELREHLCKKEVRNDL